MKERYKIYHGDALQTVKTLPDASVDCVISSPPYWQLRDYGYSEQWGLEPTFQEYLEKLWTLMDEVKRVLKPMGTAWINLGDTYGTQSGGMRGGYKQPKFSDDASKTLHLTQTAQNHKCLLLIPHRFAIGCIERNWILRNDIIWAKRNGMPESVTDRFSKKHEYFFLMAKQAKYYFDLDSVRSESITKSGGRKDLEIGGGMVDLGMYSGRAGTPENGKNPGSVSDFWDIPTRPSSAKHYATFNTELIDKPIKAGCPEGGTILDMFCGTATTGVRALQLDRRFIGIDGNRDYLKIAEGNLEAVSMAQPLFSKAI